MKLRIGVEGITLDSAHYTLSSTPSSQIHGHTYRISVEVEGEVDPSTGFIIDFGELKAKIREVAKEWDHKLIVPSRDKEKLNISGPFRVEVRYLDAPFPTVEYIGMEIAKEIYEKLDRKFKIILKIYEGYDSYAIIEYP